MKVLFLLVFLFVVSSIHTESVYAQTRSSSGIIVKFKNNQSPERIQQEVTRREANSESAIVGSVQNALEDFSYRRRGEKLPEEKLHSIEDAQAHAQVQTIDYAVNQEIREESPELANIKLVTIPESMPVERAVEIFQALPEVEYAHEDYLLELFDVPIDTHYSSQWALSSINAEDAWTITKGSENVIAAVIDSGIDSTHQDLPISTMIGHNSADGSDNTNDTEGHGTHVAGTIGAIGNNSRGITGVNWTVKLMVLKVADADGVMRFSYVADAIMYAAQNGAKVINMSLGARLPVGGSCNLSAQFLQDAINFARERNVTIVAAAGNSDINVSETVPASCNGVISVGALDPQSQRSVYSNYGSTVDIAAPGGGGNTCESPNCGINSTWKQNEYNTISGTSMAAPHVAGVIALMLAQNSNLTPDEIEQRLKYTATPITTDKPVGNKLNAHAALLAGIHSTPPTPTPTSSSNSPISGDINGIDGVDIVDFNIWRDAFLETQPDQRADINGIDGVDIVDFNIWRDAFLNSSL